LAWIVFAGEAGEDELPDQFEAEDVGLDGDFDGGWSVGADEIETEADVGGVEAIEEDPASEAFDGDFGGALDEGEIGGGHGFEDMGTHEGGEGGLGKAAAAGEDFGVGMIAEETFHGGLEGDVAGEAGVGCEVGEEGEVTTVVYAGSAVPVTLQMGRCPAQAGVTMAVR